jgi:drug/metabolite transporter (DMT)-like permease
MIFFISLVLGLISALAGAVANIYAQKVMRFTSSRNFIALNFCMLALILLPGIPFMFELKPTWAFWLAFMVIVLTDVLSNYLYFKAFEVQDAVTASTFISLAPLFTLGLIPFIHNGSDHPFTMLTVVGILLICTGIILLNRELQKSPKPSNQPAHTRFVFLLIPIGFAFITGTNIYLAKWLFSSQLVNPYTYYFIRAIMIAFFSWLIFKPDFSWVNRQTLKISFGRSLVVALQYLLLLYALEAGSPAIIKAASDTTPLFVLFYSTVILKLALTRLKILGVFLILSGLILIAL